MSFRSGRSGKSYQNPVFQSENSDEFELDEHDEFLRDSSDNIEATLEEMLQDEQNQKLDINTLNNRKRGKTQSGQIWRTGPAPLKEDIKIHDIKIGSLEGTFTDHEEIFRFKNVLSNEVSKEERSEAAATAFINYFAYLATTDETGEIDFLFTENLINATDINTRDKYGQSVMHEVAREWHTDAALFFKLRGIDIDGEDFFGRTPLFVATAVNYCEMVEWLIKHGANIYHKTSLGEGQTALHYAAKYDSVEVFDILMKHGASPLTKDDKGKTPLFVAAEYGQQRMCKHLIDMELPTAAYAHDGTSAIDHLLSKLPSDIAYSALNQFVSADPRNGSMKYYISCLGKRRWRLLNKFDHCLTKKLPPDPLEIVVERNDLRLITHPIFLKLLDLKSTRFASKYIRLNVLLYLIFTIIWTTALSMQEDNQNGWDNTNAAIFTLSCLAQCLTFFFIYKLFREMQIQKKIVQEEKTRLRFDIEKARETVHPRWPIEQRLLEKKEELCDHLSSRFFSDGWNIIEILTLLMSTVEFILLVVWISSTDISYMDNFKKYYGAVFVVVLWVRLNRSLRYLQSLGPFIAMLAECLTSTTQFAFLFFEFFIPFAAAFWVLFGSERKTSPPDGEYVRFNDLLYQLYLLTIVGDYEYQPLADTDKITAQILIGMYFFLVSIVSLNLYIALLSEAFSRVNQTASAIAYVKEAAECINIEQNFPEEKRQFEIYINKYCSPLFLKEKSKHHDNMERINVRSKLAIVGERAKTMNDGLAYMFGELDEAVGRINSTKEEMEKFTKCHDEEKLELLRDKLDDVFEFQTNFLSKAQRKTKSTFSRLVELGQEQLERLQDLRNDR